jgi:hypothetical protein
MYLAGPACLVAKSRRDWAINARERNSPGTSPSNTDVPPVAASTIAVARVAMTSKTQSATTTGFTLRLGASLGVPKMTSISDLFRLSVGTRSFVVSPSPAGGVVPQDTIRWCVFWQSVDACRRSGRKAGMPTAIFCTLAGLGLVECAIRMEGKMNCSLCGKLIRNYDPVYNCLEIDEAHAADICPDCIEKFLKWQQGIYARLFPTSAMKKRFGQR